MGFRALVYAFELPPQADDAAAVDDSNGIGGEPNLDSLPMVDRKMPCLDLLLSENILSHVLATSRMPASPPCDPPVYRLRVIERPKDTVYTRFVL